MSKPKKKVFTITDAQRIGESIGVDWTEVTVEEFCSGINVELEHGSKFGMGTNVSDDDPIVTGQIAKAHRNLENEVMRERAMWLLETVDDLF